MKKRYKNKFDKNRRDLLKILTSAGITRGLLQSTPLVGGMMLSRLAEAQSGPNKSVVIYCPDGALPNYWYPNSSLTSFPEMSQPYQSVASECNFLRGISHHNGGHGMMPRQLNNSWGGDSFEVNMGRTIGANTPFPYLNLGVHSNGHGYITKDNGTDVPFEDNPFNAFNRLFGNGGTSNGGGGNPKANIIDAHKEGVDALKSKLGGYERERLDAHLTAIEETEARLDKLGEEDGNGSCNAGSAPSSFPLTHNTFEQQAHLQADIIALALKCNLTASASIGFGNHQGEFSFPYLNFKGNYHGSIHGGSDGKPNYPYYREVRAHMSSLSAYVIKALDSAGVLDTTIVCETSDMGDGDAHSSSNIPILMAGGGGAIRRKVSNAGNSSYTPLHMLHTAAVALGADQHSKYQGYQSSVISGVIA